MTTVSAPSGVVFEGVRLKGGYVLEAALGSGVHTFVASGHERGAEATLHELGELLVGWCAPRRGRVRVNGQAPQDHPALRRRIASVLGAEPGLVGRTVGEHLDRLSAALGRDVRGEQAWLDGWRERPSASLSGSERRVLAACIALSAPAPVLAVLHEPTKLGPDLPEHVVLKRIRSWQAEGVPVVCTTTDPRIAGRLSSRVWSLAIAPRPDVPPAEYLVRSSAPRSLAARLAEDPSVTALRYEDTLPRDLWVRGSEGPALAEAIQRAIVAEKCELYEMTRLQRHVHEPSTTHEPTRAGGRP